MWTPRRKLEEAEFLDMRKEGQGNILGGIQ